MKPLMILGLALALSACGSRGELRPAEGQSLPIAPYGARTTPQPGELLATTPETQPKRNDELLTESRERRDDPFDLPPPGRR